MKKRVTRKQQKRVQINREEATKQSIEPIPLESDEEDTPRGFGGWLTTTEGLNLLRLFVVGNSIIMFLTFGWPQMKQAFEIVYDYCSNFDQLFL